MERGASGELSNLVHAGLETRNFAFAFMDIEYFYFSSLMHITDHFSIFFFTTAGEATTTFLLFRTVLFFIILVQCLCWWILRIV